MKRLRMGRPIAVCTAVLTLLALGLALARGAGATTYIVSTTNDSGGGSLRAQIAGANASLGADEIIFAIPGPGPHSIHLLSPLPAVTDTLEIDGTTQPGFTGSPIIELDGSSAGSANGLTISADDCTVRGLVINRFSMNGILLPAGADNNAIEGNYIGTDTTGTVDLGNGRHGVFITQASDNTIGGTTIEARNVVSGNDSSGVCASQAMGFVFVVGNYIGTDANGVDDLGNTLHGVEARSQSPVYVGGPLSGQRNVISGNDSCGVCIHDNGAYLCRVEGNYIGTDATGTAPVGNARDGVYIRNARGNQIGETTASARNIISGNGWEGIYIHGNASIGNVIEGNYIGTDLTGTVGMGNALPGVLIRGAHDNTVGGTTASARNVIAAGSSMGVSIDNDATGNLVQGNHIGTDVTGVAPLGHTGAGVLIWGWNTANNTIGGTTAGAGNLIAHNGLEGVLVGPWTGTTGNAVLRNSIHSNGGLGIDLTPSAWPTDGPTTNDVGDGDTGPNNYQNYPVLTLADPGPPLTLVDVFLNSTPNTAFRFEFFENSAQDPTGYGEGETYRGWATWTTDGVGNAAFTVFFDPPVQPGHCITATATDPNNNTSEFSQVVYVGPGIDLTGHVAAGNLVLDWTALPGAAEYWVYGAANQAYFVPELVSPFQYRQAALPGGTTLWSSPNGVGDPDWNWTYLVVAVGDYGQEMARSNRFGEFDFGTLVP
jgi:hypothetical protein